MSKARAAVPDTVSAAAAELLSATARRRLRSFLLAQQLADGGFRGRADASDLYYAWFGLAALAAIGARWPRRRLLAYLDRHAADARLGFLDLVTISRCLAALRPGDDRVPRLLTRLEAFRTADGGYAVEPDATAGSTYACYLAHLAYAEAARPLPRPRGLAACVRRLRTPDGAFANTRGQAAGTTTATAAALLVPGACPPATAAAAGRWLLARHHRAGGFRATPGTALPDLLSTAAALRALAARRRNLAPIRAAGLDFVCACWQPGGGFSAQPVDPTPDCEYTFYGLLALSILSNT